VVETNGIVWVVYMGMDTVGRKTFDAR